DTYLLTLDFALQEFKKSIAKDTYLLTLDFALQANDDFSNIDLDSSAWPVVIDEFVEFGRKALAPGKP
ncbi:hypothetical protein T484DRAFT_1816538, partial [Baffinella frigidus]